MPLEGSASRPTRYGYGPPKKKPRLPTFQAVKEPPVEWQTVYHPGNDAPRSETQTTSLLGSGITADEIRRFDTAAEEKKPFRSLGLSPDVQRALDEEFGYTTMTRIQEITIPAVLRGNCVLGLSETGSGKTLAYLIPAVEALHTLYAGKGNPMFLGLHTLVLAPTRELAQQITTEAERLLKFTTFIVRGMTGGTNYEEECELLLEAQVIDMLVCTPNRLLHHLDDKISRFKKVCRDIKILIIDEVDRMMDEGFYWPMRKVHSTLPNRDSRITLLFSATINAKTRRLAKRVLPITYTILSAAPERAIPQTYIVSSLGWTWCHLLRVLVAETQGPNHKVMVFFPTRFMAQFYADLFTQMEIPFAITLMSGQLRAASRKAVAETFIAQREGVLFTTDVSAHGMHYPNVTAVIQVGMPLNPEQYIHRLGRTGRAGLPGKGILLLMEFEEFFPKYVRNLGLEQAQVPRVTKQQFEEEKANLYRGLEPLLRDSAQSRKFATRLYVSLLRHYTLLRPVLEIHGEFRAVITSINAFIQRLFRLIHLPEVFGAKLDEMKLTEEDGVRRSKHYYNTMGQSDDEEEDEDGFPIKEASARADPTVDLARLRYWEQGDDAAGPEGDDT
jgi:superfamily II DNA/RNA helicase